MDHAGAAPRRRENHRIDWHFTQPNILERQRKNKDMLPALWRATCLIITGWFANSVS